MRKTYFKLIGLFLLLFFTTQSCRNESLALEQDSTKHNYNISVINNEQFESKITLSQKISKLKSNFFKQTTGKNITHPQNPILEGAIIQTNNVLEITDGDNRTYTFPVSRTFPNSVVENLVLRENSDHTYSGVLIQYTLSEQEKEKYMKGESFDLNGKIKTYSINDISVAGKGGTYSYYEGCWEYVYETNPCAGSERHGYGAACPLEGTSGAAQPNKIIAVYNHCGDDGTGSSPGGGSSPGDNDPGGSSPGGGNLGEGSNPGGSNPSGGVIIYNPSTPYNTFLFAAFDDMFNICAEGDAICEADWQLNIQVQQYLLTLSPKISGISSYNPILYAIKDYFISNGYGDAALTEKLTLIAKWFNGQNNTNADVNLENFKFSHWALRYFLNHQDSFNYFKNHPDDLSILYMDDVINSEDADFANSSADAITDILINNQNGTLNNLDLSWPNLDTVKQKVKQAISYGVYTTAKYTRNYLYLPMQKMSVKYPSTTYWSNKAIDKIRIDAVTPMVNFNANTMSWGDLFNIWLFELTPGHYANNTINFTNASNIVNGNDIYNPATNAVKNFPKGEPSILPNVKTKLANGTFTIGSPAITGYFNYNVNAFYSTLSNANIGIQMLGSFPINAKVISKSGNTAVVQFTISNDLGWESGTRFIKNPNPNGGNQGVIDDKDVGAGLHLGGTITNIFTWTETITF